jgi:hypothetical protein
MEFRVGRKAKRTIYVQLGDLASNDDTLIGIADTPEIAAVLIEGANELLRQRPAMTPEDLGLTP